MTPQNTTSSESPKPPSFWSNLFGKKKDSQLASANDGNILSKIISAGGDKDAEKKSLVDSIVKQAEKNASEDRNGGKTEPDGGKPDPEKKQESLASIAHSILVLVIIVSLGIWLYFYTTLGTNYFHDKVGKQNLTTQVEGDAERGIEGAQARFKRFTTDLSDTKNFITLLEVENLADAVLNLSLENRTLNYHRPEGELKISRNSAEQTQALYQTTDENGRFVEIPESEIRTIEDARDAIMAETIGKLTQILKTADNFELGKLKEKTLQSNFENMVRNLLKIKLAEDGPLSAKTKGYFNKAKSTAKNILVAIKDINLKNLVADLKKQAEAIDASNTDESTQVAIAELKEIVKTLSAKQIRSFEQAFKKLASFNLSQINDDAIHLRVIQIIGDGADREGDLSKTAVIARNLGTVNIINKLNADRISWSEVIKSIEGITRLGADNTLNPEGQKFGDARDDIDYAGNLVTFTGYSAKAKNDEITVKGRVLGRTEYRDENFTLLADLIDAFEGSSYFQDVEGFAFSKNKNPAGEYYSPLSFKLFLQDLGTTHPGDIQEEQTPAEISENVDPERVKEDIDFTTTNKNLSEKVELSDIVEEVKDAETEASADLTDTQTLDPDTAEVSVAPTAIIAEDPTTNSQAENATESTVNTALTDPFAAIDATFNPVITTTEN